MPGGETLLAAVRNVRNTAASELLAKHGVRKFRIPLIKWEADDAV
jgi:hypothetical protein